MWGGLFWSFCVQEIQQNSEPVFELQDPVCSGSLFAPADPQLDLQDLLGYCAGRLSAPITKYLRCVIYKEERLVWAHVFRDFSLWSHDSVASVHHDRGALVTRKQGDQKEPTSQYAFQYHARHP